MCSVKAAHDENFLQQTPQTNNRVGEGNGFWQSAQQDFLRMELFLPRCDFMWTSTIVCRANTWWQILHMNGLDMACEVRRCFWENVFLQMRHGYRRLGKAYFGIFSLSLTLLVSSCSHFGLLRSCSLTLISPASKLSSCFIQLGPAGDAKYPKQT